MNPKHLKVDGGRTILTDDGEPMLVGLAMRQSSTSPNRIKAMLVLPVQDGNMEGILPMPFASAVMAEPGKKPRGFTPEFRLEMN